jgi:hypothetical protein
VALAAGSGSLQSVSNSLLNIILSEFAISYLFDKPEEGSPLKGHRHTCEIDVKINITEVQCEGCTVFMSSQIMVCLGSLQGLLNALCGYIWSRRGAGRRVVWAVARNFRRKEAYCNQDSAKIN